jgi:hypothetical protein
MRSYGVELQVNVDTAGEEMGEVAYRWLDEVSKARAPEVRAAVVDLPARIPRGELGRPGDAFGYLRIDRWPEGRPRRHWERVPSRAGLEWLREELADVPRTVTLTLGRLDDRGHRAGDTVTVLVDRHAVAPDVMVLSTYLRESELTDAETGAAAQRSYLELLSSFADRTNPAYGHIAYIHDGKTAFEFGLRNVHKVPPLEWWSHPRTLACCREALRGYAWLTILPQDLLGRVGGLQALSDSGAFVEVRQLSHGGVWLLATTDYREFDDAALLRVFQAVAPALRPGPITPYPPAPGKPPLRVIAQDAQELWAPSTDGH